jgi:hypothetical protein
VMQGFLRGIFQGGGGMFPRQGQTRL